MSGLSKTLALSITALVLGLGASWAHAEPAAQLIKRAQADWSDQEYETVIKRVDAVLRTKKLKRAVHLEALRLKGSAHAVLGAFDLAKKAFEALLNIEPRYRMPGDTSPRVEKIFLRTRSDWLFVRETALRERLGKALTAMNLTVRVPSKGRGGRPLAIGVTLVDPKQLAKEVLLFYRRRGHQSYSRISGATLAKQTRVVIPAVSTASKTPYKLDLYVEILHGSGIALRRKGNEKDPLNLMMSAGSVPRPTPVYKKWWFWASAAALAVAVPLLVDQAIDVGPQRVTGMRN